MELLYRLRYLNIVDLELIILWTLTYPANSLIIDELTNIKALYLPIALAYNIYSVPTSYITLSYALSLFCNASN